MNKLLNLQSFPSIYSNWKDKTPIISTETVRNKLLNLQKSFPSIYSNWKDKTPIISTETVRMVTNISTSFLQIQSIFIASKKKKRFLSSGDLDLEKRSCLYSECLEKLSPRTQKLYQITCIFINPLWSLFNHLFYTN